MTLMSAQQRSETVKSKNLRMRAYNASIPAL